MSKPEFPSSDQSPHLPHPMMSYHRPESAKPAKPEPVITMPLVVRALRRWWKWAAPLGLILAAATGALLYFVFEPTYEASAWLQIEERPLYIAFESKENSTKFVQTQVELIRSPLVLAPVISRPEIARLRELQPDRGVESSMDHLARNLKIKSVGNSELFTVSWQGPSKEDAAAIVNAIVDSYMALRQHQETQRMQNVIELVQQERDRQEAEVQRRQDRVRQLSTEATAKDPLAVRTDEKGIAVLNQLTAIQERLTEAQVRRLLLEAEIASYGESTPKPQVAEDEVEKALLENPDMLAQESYLSQLQAELSQLEALLAKGKDDPRYQKKLAEFQQRTAAIEQFRGDLRGRIRADMQRVSLAQNEKRLNELKSDLSSANRIEEHLLAKIAEVRGNMAASSESSTDLLFEQADLNREQDVFERIASRLVALKTEQRAPERVSLMQRAEVPTAPMVTMATLYKKMGVASMGAFCMPFALFVLLERLLRRVSDAQQLKDEFRLPVVGEIARLPAAGGLGRVGSRRREDLQLFQESVDTLRISLITSESLRDMQVLAVTSAGSNEGKTSVAVQLAVSIARASGQKTLLIDGDLRSPDVHNVLGLEASPGLAELLAHESQLKDDVIQSWSSQVDVLSAGRLRISPHRLLGNGDFYELLEELRPRYRYIIVDTPPVLSASEAVILNRAADACLLCTMRDVSRVDQVIETHARLVAAGAKPVGTVLNGVPTRQYGYYYGRYGYTIDS